MNDESRRPPGQIRPMEAVAVSQVDEDPEHADPWSVGQPEDCASEATPAPIEIQGHPDLAIYETEVPPVWNEGRGSKSVDQIGGIPDAPPARVHEVRTPSRDEALVPIVPGDRHGLRVGLVTGALVAALGLGWTGGLNLYRFLDLNSATTRLQQNALPYRAAPGVGQQIASGAPNTGEVSTPAASDLDRRPGIGHKSSPGATQPATLPNTVPSIVQQNTTSVKPTAVPVQRSTPGAGTKFRAKPTATPDTRPNTIEGWTVRNIFAGTAVLEGPEGIRKVSIGDTVPGVGRVDAIVRWGSRWVVATSRSLITTD
jgi:hypothetical protein